MDNEYNNDYEESGNKDPFGKPVEGLGLREKLFLGALVLIILGGLGYWAYSSDIFKINNIFDSDTETKLSEYNESMQGLKYPITVHMFIPAYQQIQNGTYYTNDTWITYEYAGRIDVKGEYQCNTNPCQILPDGKVQCKKGILRLAYSNVKYPDGGTYTTFWCEARP